VPFHLRNRYDLRVLFDKAHGEFSVNVQALARVRFPILFICAVDVLRKPRQGANPIKDVPLGAKGCAGQLRHTNRSIVEAAYRSLGERPVIIGECGVPMDMNRRAAFKSDDWTWQRRMMDAMITGSGAVEHRLHVRLRSSLTQSLEFPTT
jgi:predicted TIM-barrel fold metal-dependent hydrolase